MANEICEFVPSSAGLPPTEIRRFCYLVTPGGTCGYGNETTTYSRNAAGAVIATVTYADLLGVAVVNPQILDCELQPCLTGGGGGGAAGPVPAIITANMVDCAGTATTQPSAIAVQAIPHPTAVQNVRMCSSAPAPFFRELAIPGGTGRVLVTQTFAANGTPNTPTAVNWPANTPYAGALDLLEEVPDTDRESDPVNWCVDGVNFTQWAVKNNGQPTGAVFWTNSSTGAVVANPLPGGTVVAIGACGLPVTAPAVRGTTSGVDVPVPAGLRAVSIMRTNAAGSTAVVNITMSDGSVYPLTKDNEVFSQSSDLVNEGALPAYAVAVTGGGTYKWHGIR